MDKYRVRCWDLPIGKIFRFIHDGKRYTIVNNEVHDLPDAVVTRLYQLNRSRNVFQMGFELTPVGRRA